MCFRTKLNSKIREIEKVFDAQFSEPELYEPREEINGFDFSSNPVVTDYAPGEILLFNWGLIPFWAKNENLKKSTLNARIESLAEKPAFRNAIENRCLVIANGYYEWQWLDEKGRKKQKYLITSAEEEIFAFAGIYSHWQHPESGEKKHSYSIITTQANELMSEIHNNKQRMPVILNAKDRRAWLEGASHDQFAFPYEFPLRAQKI
ncbi:SOS response-associated peptidase [Salinimicrobium xinjiangense]|uniref:SOS response-associated peptidase n=1 Tax=Salinimicrobium xinjiangense TaxID=438596 RepID=UPI00041F98AD|nr:SOS response-associated peptidase [Salinimicrobium xinjiangense]